jgi:hypothetical protein
MSPWGTFRWRTGSSRWRQLAVAWAIALAASVSAAPTAALAAYQGSVYSNWTAFNPCLGIVDSYPDKMRTEAVAALTNRGFATSGFTKDTFTKSKFLGRTPGDWAVYVHSHGDFYNNKPGFRADGGVCSGSIVSSADIATKRPSTQQTNLVVMSTCYLGSSDSRNDMPLVYGIQKLKAGINSWRGPEFYLGYIGSTWDNDQWEFEVILWDRLMGGSNLGSAFDVALGTGHYAASFDADWWGSYTYMGHPGPYTSCSKCL